MTKEEQDRIMERFLKRIKESPFHVFEKEVKTFANGNKRVFNEDSWTGSNKSWIDKALHKLR